jgi:hypothetical protein
MLRRIDFLLVIFLFSVSLLSTGCATIMSRGYDDLTIESNPTGAKVYLGAEHLGTTPFTKRFERVTFETPEITFRKEGYKTQTVMLGRSLAPISLWNFIFFPTAVGVTSWGIDAGTGNMIQYTPDSYLLDLQKTGEEGSTSWKRRHRVLAFVLTNQLNLMKDISKGGGEHLNAYYQLDIASKSTISYPSFLETVRKNSGKLVFCMNGLELHQMLKDLGGTTVSRTQIGSHLHRAQIGSHLHRAQ